MVLLGLCVDRKGRQFAQFVPGLESSTTIHLFCFESFGQQLQQICIYLSRYDLLITVVGFESYVCQLHGIDVQVTKGGVGCEFVGLFWGVFFALVDCLDGEFGR